MITIAIVIGSLYLTIAPKTGVIRPIIIESTNIKTSNKDQNGINYHPFFGVKINNIKWIVSHCPNSATVWQRLYSGIEID